MATVLGLDDTDSREAGMCTTYVGARIADALEAAGHPVTGRRLVRLNPAVAHKTRGNAAIAIETEAEPEEAFDLARPLIDDLAIHEPATNPGLVAVDACRSDRLGDLAWRAVRDFVSPARVRDRLAEVEALTWSRGSGRGLIGSTAAVGAGTTLPEWTAELLAYRRPGRRGTPRDVDRGTLRAAADRTYPLTWDTIDREADEAVCVPNAPGPVLVGIRGDSPAAVREAANRLDHEPVERRSLYATNQGTDLHLRPATPGAVRDGRSYAVSGIVVTQPEARRGGHVHVRIAAGDAQLPCVAFEPTGRFRDRVRDLRVGDRVTVCGEVGKGTLKLEKFALRRPRRFRRVVPDCPRCGARMESAGAEQGYRCRACATARDARRVEPIERSLAVGWYEVPPTARRHLARPLVRGGFDAPVHPER